MHPEHANELPRGGSLYSFIAAICLIVPTETFFISYMARGWVRAGGIAWADAWMLPFLAGLFLLAAAPGLSIITQHPRSNETGAATLRWVVIGAAVLLWVFVSSPLIGWSMLWGLSPFLWITFAYKRFSKQKPSAE